MRSTNIHRLLALPLSSITSVSAYQPYYYAIHRMMSTQQPSSSDKTQDTTTSSRDEKMDNTPADEHTNDTSSASPSSTPPPIMRMEDFQLPWWQRLSLSLASSPRYAAGHHIRSLHHTIHSYDHDHYNDDNMAGG
jgi:hypothetical protein